jgi:hypothetical protein
MLVGVVLGVMFVPVVALVAADVACFASAAANLVLIEVDAANLFSNPCSVSVAGRSRKMINELVAQHALLQPRPPPTTPTLTPSALEECDPGRCPGTLTTRELARHKTRSQRCRAAQLISLESPVRP